MSANHRLASGPAIDAAADHQYVEQQGVVLLLEHGFRIHVVDPVSDLLAGLHQTLELPTPPQPPL